MFILSMSIHGHYPVSSVYCSSDGTPMSPHDLAKTMILDVLSETGITATAGIGPNMYLAKIAMDIVAKHVDADKDGVRIAELDEMNYRKLLWDAPCLSPLSGASEMVSPND